MGHKVDVMLVDYMDLLMPLSKKISAENLFVKDKYVSEELRNLAVEKNCVFVTAAQLNRGAEGRQDHRPLLSDLRESGSIEQDADVIFFLYREGYYDKESADQSISECIIAKNRHGETGTVKLAWNGEFTLFRNLEGYRDEN